MELDFEQLVKLSEASTNPQVQANVLSVTDLLKSGNELFNNIEKIFALLERAERSPLISGVVRAQAGKAGVSLEPLNKEPMIKIVEVGVKPVSETHKAMFEELNKMDEATLKENLKKYSEAQNDGVHTENRETDNK